MFLVNDCLLKPQFSGQLIDICHEGDVGQIDGKEGPM
jgi:hypothetical protein